MIFPPSKVEVALTDEGYPATYVKVGVSMEYLHQVGKEGLWKAFLEAYRIATGEDYNATN